MATGSAAPPGKNDEPNTLTCAVCLERYHRPKLLPCFHTFCQHCLQAVVGTSPSFPCPACRTVVLLPPGGVPSLQTNFYIEQDEDAQTPSPARLCDVCIQDKEATHLCLQCQQRYCSQCRKVHDSITSSRAHTVIPLQPGGLDGDVRRGRSEDLCPEHKSRALVLRCVPCRTNICLQCMKTEHEGHTVEDLQDVENKVKARLQQRLQTLSHQASRLQGILAAVREKHDTLIALHNTTEQGIRDRVMKGHQLLDECQENTLGSLETLHQGLLESLSTAEEYLQHSHAAVTAQTQHIIRILLEGKDTHMADLETTLRDVSLDDKKTTQILMRLQPACDPYICEHNPVATCTAQLQGFVGILRKSDDGNLVSDSDSVVSAVDNSLTSAADVSASVSRPLPRSVTVVEVVYSKNPKSTVTAMCSTSEKRVWVKYRPSGDGDAMALFGRQGRVKDIDAKFPEGAMVTVLTDTTIGTDCWNNIHWIKTDGLSGKEQSKLGYIDSIAKTCREESLYGVLHKDPRSFSCCRFHVTSLDTSQWKTTVLHSVSETAYLEDVSKCSRYFLYTVEGTASLYLADQFEALQRISTYPPDGKRRILDACFFPVGGKESLLVVVEGDNQVHVLDHTDGCCFVQYLDTGHLTLQNPRLLATDQETVLWVACDGGKLFMMQVKAKKSYDSSKFYFSYRCGIL